MYPSRTKYLKAWSSVDRIFGKDLRYDLLEVCHQGVDFEVSESMSFQLALSASWMLPQDVTSGLQFRHYACLATCHVSGHDRH